MISVIEVFNNVRAIANKDQRGFITPEMFNSMLPAVQSKLFKKLYDYAVEARTLRARNIDLQGADSMLLRAKDLLSEYIVSEAIQTSSTTETEDPEGRATGFTDVTQLDKPENLNKLISITVGDSSVGSATSVDLVYNTENISRILNSNLSAPTTAYPVALISTKIEIFPSTSDDVYCAYYRNPRSRYETSGNMGNRGDVDMSSLPVYSARTVSDGFVVPNPNACRAFDLPNEMQKEVVMEICTMMGVSLRDPLIVNYGSQPTS